MWHVMITVGILLCAIQAIRVQRLLVSALWLAGASALTALLLYLLGAPEIAVIELSVGAGLVTVLFVFAINIAGEDAQPIQSLIPKPLAIALLLVAGGLLIWRIAPPILAWSISEPQDGFANVLWNNRYIDVLLLVALIFSGVLGVLGLLAEAKPDASEEEHS
jgi:uncharacterized MnhB-related membrane protein